MRDRGQGGVSIEPLRWSHESVLILSNGDALSNFMTLSLILLKMGFQVTLLAWALLLR